MNDKSKSIALRVLVALLALTFLTTGSSKVLAVPPSPENFARWGFSPAFMVAIGLVEIVCGVGLLVRRVAPFAALVLLATMLGALETGIAHREALHIFLPLLLIALLAFVLYARRDVFTRRDR